MIPKQETLKIKMLCLNTNQDKGIVESKYKCKYGEKR